MTKKYTPLILLVLLIGCGKSKDDKKTDPTTSSSPKGSCIHYRNISSHPTKSKTQYDYWGHVCMSGTVINDDNDGTKFEVTKKWCDLITEKWDKDKKYNKFEEEKSCELNNEKVIATCIGSSKNPTFKQTLFPLEGLETEKSLDVFKKKCTEEGNIFTNTPK